MRRLGRASVALILSIVLLLTAILCFASVWPVADGGSVASDGELTVDRSHAADGYVMVKGRPSEKRLKLRVKRGDNSLYYDINTSGEYEIIPLQYGSGSYSFELFKNTKGTKYAAAGSVSAKCELTDENAAFLIPSQFVPYDVSSECVALSEQLCGGLSTDKAKIAAVQDYIARNLVYDYVKAVTVAANTLPDIDGCLKKRMGICQDLAALTAALLRLQGIPTVFVIGYADNNYHAWNMILTDGEWVLYDPTAAVTGGREAEYTVERYY